MAITWEEYQAEIAGNADNKTTEQIWDDADSSQDFRLKGGDAPEVFHDITPTGDTNNARSKVYKQIAQLNGIPLEEAVKQVDAEAEAAKVDPNLGLRLKELRASGEYTGPFTSHEIYQLGKEATMATDEAEAGKFDDRSNILDARTSFADSEAAPVEVAEIDPSTLEKGYFGRGLLDTETTDEMVAKGYFVPGADPVTNKKQYELQRKAAEKAKKLGMGAWADPGQAKIMDAIVDTSYAQNKYLDQVREEGKSNIFGGGVIDESIDTIQSGTAKVGAGAIGLLGKGLKAAGEYNQAEANKVGENYSVWDAASQAGEYLDDLGTRGSKYADAYFGADGSEGEMVANVTNELMKGEIGNAVDEVTLKDSVKLVAGMVPFVVGMMTGSGQVGLWSSISNEGIEEAKAESSTGEISDARTAAILGTSALILGLERLGIDAVFRGKTPRDVADAIPKSVQNELVKKVTKSGGLIAVEGLTEPVQELLTVLSTQVGQEDGNLSEELERVLSDEENVNRLAQAAVGGTIAGGTVRAAVDGPGIVREGIREVGKGTRSAAQTAGKTVNEMNQKRAASKAKIRAEELTKKRTEFFEAKEDVGSYGFKDKVKDETETVNIGGKDTELFRSPTNLKVESKDAAEYQKKLEEEKDKVVQSLYEIDPTSKKIVGLSEDAKIMNPEELDGRISKVKSWLEGYKEEYTDADGVVESTAAEQVDYVLGADAEVQLEEFYANKEADELQSREEELARYDKTIAAAEEKLKTAEGKEAEKMQEVLNEFKKERDSFAKDLQDVKTSKVEDELVSDAEFDVELDKLTKEELTEKYTNELTEKYTVDGTEYKDGWTKESVDEVASKVAERTYEIKKKYRFDSPVEVDYEGLTIDVRNAKDKKTKSVQASQVSGNKLVDAIVAGKPEEALGEYDSRSSKLANRVFGKISSSKTGSKYEAAVKVVTSIKDATKSEKMKDSLESIFTEEGIESGDAVVLGMNALGAINASVVTDTLARQSVETSDVAGQTANLKQNEFWASQTNVVTQIGKDFMTSRGLKLTRGTPTQQAEQYRKIGMVGLELAIESGLVERSNENISSVVSEQAVTADGAKLKSGVSNTSLVSSAVDSLNTDKEVVLNLSDYGVRVVGDNVAIDGAGYVQQYDNENGDIAGRINKLLVPNNLQVPNSEASDTVVVSDTVDPLDSERIKIVDTVKKLQKVAYQIDPKMLKVFEGIKKEVDEQYDGNLDKYLSDNGEWVAQMLGIDRYDSKSQILAFNDAGVSNGIKDSLRGIIDNLDDLKEPFYFTYQIDKNNRITIRETVLNFQADKVIARQILTTAKSGVEYDMGSAAVETQIEMLNELGFKAAAGADVKAEYDKAVDIIVNGKYENKPKGELSKGEKIAWEIVDLLTDTELNLKDGELNVQGMVEALNDPESPLYGKGSGKSTIKAMKILDGFRVMRKTGGKRTNYLVETDAKASGVMNVLMNIIGFDVNNDGELSVEALLGQLGVELVDGTALESPKDAYNLLQEKVEEVLADDGKEGRRSANKYSTARKLIGELDKLGIDTRELAKPPVMTWFYTAGTETIVNELANTLLENVFRKAIDGDQVALSHINGVLGRESTSELDLRKMKARGPEHKKLLEAYKEIGSLYESRLDKAFPGVVKFKKTMQKMFEAIEDTGYTNGIVESAAQSIYGGDKKGTFNIHKEKQYALELDADKVGGKSQLKKDAEGRQLVTGNKLFANFTSLIPLLAQGVDFSILEKTMREMFAKYEGKADFAPMTVHDAIYSPLKYMKDTGTGTYNRTIVDVAKNYDFVDTIIKYGESTLQSMNKATGSMKGTELTVHKAKIAKLEKELAEWKKDNDARVEYKKSKLVNTDGEDIEVDLMGGIERKQEGGDSVGVSRPKSISPAEVLKNSAKNLQDPFTEVTENDVNKIIGEFQKAEYGQTVPGTLEEYSIVLGVEATPSSVVEALIENRDLTVLQNPKAYAADVVRSRAVNKFGVDSKKDIKKSVEELISTLVGLGDKQAKTMQDITKNRSIEWVWGDRFEIGPSETADARIVLVENSAKLSTNELILDTIGHELEHANSAGYIDGLSKGKGSKEDIKAYNTIASLLGKINKSNVRKDGRLARVLSESKDVDRVIEFVAVMRGESTSAKVVEEIRSTGMLKSLINKGINAAKALIARVRNEKIEVTENMEIEQLVQAVEQIHKSAMQIESVTDRKSGYEALSKAEKDKMRKLEAVSVLRDRVLRMTTKQDIPRLKKVLEKIKDC